MYIMSSAREHFLTDSPTSRSVNQRKLHCLCVSLVLSLILSILLGTIVTTCIVLKPDLHTPLSTSGDAGSVCFTCDYLKSGVESTETLYNLLNVGNHTFCCLKEADELSSAIIRMAFSDRKIDEGSTPVSPREMPLMGRHTIGAHLYRDVKAPVNDEGVLSWKRDQISYLAYNSGIIHRASRLHIPFPGRYLIYSHITYKQTSKDSKSDDFVHFITRKHPRQPNLGEVTLLFSRNSYSIDKSTGSSFLSAVLVMRTNDSLAVKVSDIASVHNESLFSYFGVLKL